jgi:hypothetical protein
VKVTITRLLETSKLLATKVGQEIPDFFSYMSDFVEQVTRALRGGLSFADNFNCEVRTISLKHNTPQVLEVTKPVTGMIPTRLQSRAYLIDAFNWFYDSDGRLTIQASIKDKEGNLPTDALSVAIVILF